ncbi:MAG: LacI family transcriptional regulator [Opitutaceae bacterium]|jgi:LacI family transcriptional regulator|nr:LacI family transcriptional regulator [Opitutaceae bacterium]
MRKTTLSDIARKLGISSSSVSKALSGGTGGATTRISPDTMRRIQDVAREMNYRGNSSARAMRSNRFQNIGFFDTRKNTTDYSFTESILSGLSECAERTHQNIVLIRVPRQDRDLVAIPRALREEGLDALIIANTGIIGAAFQEAVEASNIPVIYLNEKRPTNAVYVNDVVSGRIATAHLIERGFRRIAMLVPFTSGGHYGTVDRITGYLGIMREAGREPLLKTFTRSTWRYDTREWLTDPAQRPDAIFCANDHVALMLQRILYDLRIHIPGDIAIAGCDSEQLALHSPVPLTSVEIPFRRMGFRAMEMALKCVNQKTRRAIPSVIFEPRLIVRESTINCAGLSAHPRFHLHEDEPLDVDPLTIKTSPPDRDPAQ